MTGPPEDTRPAPELAPARRPRWRRFSPSMGWRAFWSEIAIVVLGLLPELRFWVANQGVAINVIANYRASANAMLTRKRADAP